MALMTGEEYIESIGKMKVQVYMFGKKVERPVDDPILRPSLNSVRMTYDLAQQAEYEDLMTAISPYTGKRVNQNDIRTYFIVGLLTMSMFAMLPSS